MPVDSPPCSVTREASRMLCRSPLHRPPGMVHGTLWPGPQREVRGGNDGTADVGLGFAHRVGYRVTDRQQCCDGGSQRATCAMGVSGLDQLRAEVLATAAAALAEHIDRLFALDRRTSCRLGSRVALHLFQVSSFDQYPRRAHLTKVPRCLLHVLDTSDRPAGQQQLRLGQVRCDDRGLREELLLNTGDSILMQQHVAARGHHDGVQDQAPTPTLALAAPRAQRGRHRRHDLGGRKHARLHDIGAQVFQNGAHLLLHEVDGYRKDGLHALRVLRGQRRDRGGAEGPQGSARLHVGLDAGPSAAV
mmetsp:Transcript_3644/g.13388  ORF Transcript_3644/g.13388 Transcript_3644/m.13388 type:complete len:304 (-) Transcript_3644:795-1706(-)